MVCGMINVSITVGSFKVKFFPFLALINMFYFYTMLQTIQEMEHDKHQMEVEILTHSNSEF